MAMGWALMVMPRLALEIHGVEHLVLLLALWIVPVNSSRRSESVVFPWSMWAMMQKLRVRVWGMAERAAHYAGQGGARSTRAYARPTVVGRGDGRGHGS